MESLKSVQVGGQSLVVKTTFDELVFFIYCCITTNLQETNMSLSILNKLKDVTIEDKAFTDQDSGEMREYKRLHLVVQIDGEDEIVEAQLVKSEGKSGYRLLKLADEQ